MRVDGRLGADGADEVDLLRRVRDVVVSADHVCDAVPDVLHRRREVVRRTAVGADHDEVLELGVRELDASANHVVPRRRPLVRHPKADRALVLVRLPLGDEPPGELAAVVHPVELEGVVAVPVEPEPTQGRLDLVDRLRDLTARVGVLDPQLELPAVVPGVQPVEDGRPNTADVEHPGRAGRETDTNRHVDSVGAMRVLTLRELNRTTLLRQMLLHRERRPPAAAIERLAALQAQRVSSPYVALWSRLEGFTRDRLTRALRREDVVKASLMRGTLHLVSARDYPLYVTALRKEVAPWSNGRPEPAPELVAAVTVFVEREPRTTAELVAFLEERRGPATQVENLRDLAWLGHLIPLEPLPDAAVWGFVRGKRLRAFRFRPPQLEEALARLIRRYLAAFGPATRADLAAWSGQTLKVLDPALERLAVQRFLDEEGHELLDLPRAPIAHAGTSAPVRLLSSWDELLIAHADRRRVLPDEHAGVGGVTHSGAQTVLVDGLVAGTWKLERERVVVEPFGPLPRSARRELEDEAGRLEGFLR